MKSFADAWAAATLFPTCVGTMNRRARWFNSQQAKVGPLGETCHALSFRTNRAPNDGSWKASTISKSRLGTTLSSARSGGEGRGEESIGLWRELPEPCAPLARLNPSSSEVGRLALRGVAAQRDRRHQSRFMESLHDFKIARWDHEPLCLLSRPFGHPLLRSARRRAMGRGGARLFMERAHSAPIVSFL